MKKIILLLILLNIFSNNFSRVPIQCPPSNKMLDYWYYRDRLKYFVVPGSNQGESEIMDRNRLDDPNPSFVELKDYRLLIPIVHMGRNSFILVNM